MAENPGDGCQEGRGKQPNHQNASHHYTEAGVPSAEGINQQIPQESNPWACSLEKNVHDSTCTTTAVLGGQGPSVLVGKMTKVQIPSMGLYELLDWQNVTQYILV